MWGWLRNKRLEGYRFCRQYGVEKYIIDFYCPETRLAIELDGSSHQIENKRNYDQQRTTFLNKKNIVVLRFFNSEVIYKTKEVCQEILNKIRTLENNNSLLR